MLEALCELPALLIGVVALVFLYLVFPLVVVVPISFSAGEGLAFPPPSYSFAGTSTWRHRPRLDGRDRDEPEGGGAHHGDGDDRRHARGDRALPTRRGRGLMTGFFLSPLVVPVVVLAIAVYRFFGLLGLNGSALGLAIAHTIIATPFVVLTVSAGLARFDTQVLLASASLGRGRRAPSSRSCCR